MLNGEHAAELLEAWLWWLTHEPDSVAIRDYRPMPGSYPPHVRSGEEREIPCPICLEAPARVKADRKGKRFLSCGFCVSRLFLVDERFWDGLDVALAFIGEHGDWVRERIANGLGWVRFGKAGLDAGE